MTDRTDDWYGLLSVLLRPDRRSLGVVLWQSRYLRSRFSISGNVFINFAKIRPCVNQLLAFFSFSIAHLSCLFAQLQLRKYGEMGRR